MNPTDNEQFIKWSKWLMILSGFWKRPIGTNPIVNQIISVYAVVIKIIYVSFWLSLIAELLRLILQHYGISLIMSSIGVVVNATKMQVKIVIFLKNGLGNLFDYVIKKEEGVWKCNDEDIKSLYAKKVTYCRKFMIMQVMLSFGAIIALNAVGVYGNSKLIEYNHRCNASLETHLMYQIWFPATKLDHLVPYYTVMLLYSWSGFVYSCITHMMFINLLIFGAVQLQILQIKLRKVVDNSHSIKRNAPTQLLKELIVEHKNVIHFVNTLNTKTRSIVLMEFVLSSLDVASVARSLTNENLNMSNLAWMGLFFLLLSLQIFAMAWNTNEIQIQSVAISDAIFESSWYLMDREGRQLIHIVIMRAQKPLAITIGPFGPMTTQSALLMFKAAYSYISIM